MSKEKMKPPEPIGLGYLRSRRHALLIELGSIESALGISPTTKQLREMYKAGQFVGATRGDGRPQSTSEGA